MAAQQYTHTGVRRRELACLMGLLCGGRRLRAAADGRCASLPKNSHPTTTRSAGKITGLGTEVVEAVLQQLGLQGQFQSMPWARAYETASNVPGVLIYSMVRTPEREKRFKWVGVIAPSEYYLFSLADKRLTIDSLGKAQGLQIGTVNQSVGEQFLLSRGFVKGKNLQTSARNELNYEKLRLGHIDLWIMNRLTAYHLVRQAGQDPEKTLQKALAFQSLVPRATTWRLVPRHRMPRWSPFARRWRHCSATAASTGCSANGSSFAAAGRPHLSTGAPALLGLAAGVGHAGVLRLVHPGIGHGADLVCVE